MIDFASAFTDKQKLTARKAPMPDDPSDEDVTRRQRSKRMRRSSFVKDEIEDSEGEQSMNFDRDDGNAPLLSKVAPPKDTLARSWMQANYADVLGNRDGHELVCLICHDGPTMGYPHSQRGITASSTTWYLFDL